MEDIAGLHKRLAFRNIEIITLADGSVSKLHMGLRAIIASSFLDDLALKTRRGQAGRVGAGYIPGGRCYGYDVVAGGAQRGRRTINAVEAEIVRRISRSMSRDIRRLLSLRGSMVRACPHRGGALERFNNQRLAQAAKWHPLEQPLCWASDLQSTALFERPFQRQTTSPGEPPLRVDDDRTARAADHRC